MKKSKKSRNMKGQYRFKKILISAREIVTRRGVLTAIFTLLAAVIIPSGLAQAWGPQRNTFTMQNPAPYVTFNSITDNPDWGDERGFVVIKGVAPQIFNPNGSINDAEYIEAARSGGFSETVSVASGDHIYMVKMLVHNNAAENLNLVAKNTRARVFASSAVSDNATVIGWIKADNCGANNSGMAGSECTFWDEAYLTGANGLTFGTYFEPGSVRFFNNIRDFDSGGFSMSEDGIFESAEGELLGYNNMDGDVPGCFQYSGYMTFLVYVTEGTETFSLTKQVRLAGDTEWHDVITAEPGDDIEYRIVYEDLGDPIPPVYIGGNVRSHENVILHDMLPEGVTYVPGTTTLINANNPTGMTIPQGAGDTLTTTGINIGNYETDSNAITEFDAVVPSEDQLFCGENLLQNNATGTTSDGTLIASADVIVNKDCTNPCPTNPSLDADDPNCKPAVEQCKWDKDLTADDPNCVGPAGSGSKSLPSSKASLIILVSLAGILLMGMLVRNHIMRKKTSKK